MGLQISKFVGGMLLPLPVVLFLFVAGIALLASKRRKRMGVLLLVLSFLLLSAVSAPVVGERALYNLENTYPLLSDDMAAGADWIVVLGGGVRFGPDRPPAARLGEASLCRIMEGVRLAHALPEARLVVSAFGVAEVMAELARDLGICGERIVISGRPLNTHQEAMEVAKIVRDEDIVVLVTSAAHMRRAVSLFEGQGISVVPAPTGHVATGSVRRAYLVSYLPRAENISFLETVVRERLGLAWAHLNGWTR